LGIELLVTILLMLLRVSTDGTYAKTELRNWSGDHTQDPSGAISCSGAAPQSPFRVLKPITNADQGVAVFASAIFIRPLITSGGDCGQLGGSVAPLPDNMEQATFVANDSVTSQPNLTTQSFVPALQREDGSYIGTDINNQLDAVNLDGTSPWQTKINPDADGNATPVKPLHAMEDGGTIASSDPPGTVFTIDAAGNLTTQVSGDGTPASWSGETYVSVNSGISNLAMPLIYSAGASFWPQAAGNPSSNSVAIVQCPCLLQSDNSLQGSAPHSPRFAYSGLLKNVSFSSFFLPPPDNRKYVLLSGDPGLNTVDAQGHVHGHNVGRLFNLAAQTKARDLVNAGAMNIVNVRISSFQDFSDAITTNGLIDGEIVYFGHAGVDQGGRNALFPGETAGVQTNVTSLNIGNLSNVHLGPNVTITLNACHAGYGGTRSVANQIAVQLKRTVFAYPLDMYFSSDPTPRAYKKGMVAPSGVPVYMVPNADGMQPTRFPLDK
jgi:hypothetical protein